MHGEVSAGKILRNGPKATTFMRLRGAIVCAACLIAVAAAWSLDPLSSGYGTHQQAGLPQCSFLANHGIPCPGCGVTTSIALSSRGRFMQAFAAQPFGIVMFMAAVVLAAMGAAELIGGRDFLKILRLGRWCIWAAVFILLAGWGFKLAMGFATGRFPIR